MDRSSSTSFTQIPLSRVWNRIENGDKVLSEYITLLHSKHDNEEKNAVFHVKSSRMNIHENEIKESTSEQALGYLKNYFLYNSKEQIQYHKEFGETVIRMTDEVRVSRNQDLNKHKAAVQHELAAVTHSSEALEKAKKNLVKAKQELEQSRDKLSSLEVALVEHERKEEEKRKESLVSNANGQSSSSSSSKFSVSKMLITAFETTPEQERDKQSQRVERRYGRMIECIADIGMKKKNLVEKMEVRDAAIGDAAAAFYDAEVHRIKSFKQSMQMFCSLEKKVLLARLAQLEALSSTVDEIQPEGDVAIFCQQEKKPELTHKYTKALTIMDWNHNRMAAAAAATAAAATAAAATESVTDSSTDNNSSSGDINSSTVSVNSSSALVEDRNDGVDKMKKLIERLFGDIDIMTATNDCDAVIDSEEMWTSLLLSKPACDMFLQELDDRRGRQARLINKHSYNAIAIAMRIFLDYCSVREDVKSAMRIANMANTFHIVPDDVPIPVLECHKIYLQKDKAVKDHPIWLGQGFWQAALLEGVSKQMDLMPLSDTWDELSGDALREAVINVHNVIFGQLVTIAFTMHELGLQYGEVKNHVLSMSKSMQLAEDQEIELMRSVDSTFNNNNDSSSVNSSSNSISVAVDRSAVPPVIVQGVVVVE